MRAATQETGKGDSHQLAQVERPRCFKVGVGCGFPRADSCLQGAEPSSHGPIGGMSVSPAVGSLGRSAAAGDNAELCVPPAALWMLRLSFQCWSLPADRELRSPRAQDLVRGLVAASARTLLRTHSRRAAWTPSLCIPKPLISLLP